MRSLRCMVGRHRWRTEYTADRQPYRRCARCHCDGPGFGGGSHGAPMGETSGLSRLGDALGP
jgi:hypothetical protein